MFEYSSSHFFILVKSVFQVVYCYLYLNGHCNVSYIVWLLIVLLVMERYRMHWNRRWQTTLEHHGQDHHPKSGSVRSKISSMFFSYVGDMKIVENIECWHECKLWMSCWNCKILFKRIRWLKSYDWQLKLHSNLSIHWVPFVQRSPVLIARNCVWDLAISATWAAPGLVAACIKFAIFTSGHPLHTNDY